jgi:F420-dependent oxidoreductase-like protein
MQRRRTSTTSYGGKDGLLVVAATADVLANSDRPLSAAIAIGGAASGSSDDWNDRVQFTIEAERLGVTSCWAGEAWGEDAFTPLAFLAARTSRVTLATGIAQISARSPSMTAMTAITMAKISGGRFALGLGVSGPQVAEGLHGVKFDHPIGRLAEFLDILGLAFREERLEYKGEHWTLPLPGGEGKPLRLAQPMRYPIPIYLAALNPASLALTGQRADGWVGTCFVPEAADVLLGPIKEASEAAGRSFSEIDIHVPGRLAFGDDLDVLRRPVKATLARTIGAMGSARTNYYRRALSRAGYADETAAVHARWEAGDRDAAAEAVPDQLVDSTNFLGTNEQVANRIRAFAAAGVTTIRFDPAGSTTVERLETLARGLDILTQVSQSTSRMMAP